MTLMIEVQGDLEIINNFNIAITLFQNNIFDAFKLYLEKIVQLL
jgi:hypothetical protein